MSARTPGNARHPAELGRSGERAARGAAPEGDPPGAQPVTSGDKPAARANAPRLTIGVVVPTFRRRTGLVACLDGLAAQTRPIDEIVVVVRDEDADSQRAVEAWRDEHEEAGGRLRMAIVSRPGQIPALNAGLAAATTDVVCFTDDDCVPRPDWVERLARHFADESVGGAGGRDCLHSGGATVDGEVAAVGRHAWYGRPVGNHHLELRPARPVSCDVLKGANMAFRRELIADAGFDEGLQLGAAQCNDSDISLGVRRQGFRLVYDPAAVVDHYPAERFGEATREQDAPHMLYAEGHNWMHVALKHARLWQVPAVVGYGFLIGHARAYGLARAARALGEAPPRLVASRLRHSLRGKWAALAGYLGRGQGAAPAGCGDGRLDIAILTEHANLGGGQERVVRELAARWAQRHRVTLYCYSAAADLRELGVEVAEIRPSPRSRLVASLLYPWLASRRVAWHHDVVLANGGNALRCDFSLFHTCHPLRLETMRLVARERGRPLSARERVTATVRRQFFAPMERRALRSCRGRAYAVSQRTAEDLARVHGLGPGAVKVAPNGVDLANFNPCAAQQREETRRALGVGDDDLLALFLGGIWWEKGVHVAIEALAQARSTWTLAVAGSDDDEASFRRLAERLGVAERVLFVGRTSRPRDLYGAADCLILPSGFESFSLVSVEAAACGLPVLISHQGDALGIFAEGAGLVLDRDPAAFAAGLDELAASPQRRAAMGRVGAERAQAFTWERQAQILEDAFREYVAAHCRRPRR